MPQLSALILTHNEGPSIQGVVEKVLGVLRQLDPEAQVVVVDGASKDGTAENAQAGGAVVHQQKDPGYGAAFREGLGHVTSDYVVTLDADLSHDPDIIPQLWERRRDADIVIGSRYTRGGSAALTPFRRFLSAFLNGTYRWVLDLPIADLSSGFRLYRRSAIEGIHLISPKFDVLEEILIKAYNRGFQVLEIPIHFQPRLHGESHLRVISFGLAYGKTLWRMGRIRHAHDAADYDARAARSVNVGRRLWAWRRRELLRQLLHRHGTMLDLGGTGAALLPRSTGDAMVSADDTGVRLRPLRQRDVSRLLVTPSRLPFPPGTFGAVCCTSTAFTSAEGLAEIKRVLQPGGELVVFPDRVAPGVRARLAQAGFEISQRACAPGASVLVARLDARSPEAAGPVGVLCPKCGDRWDRSALPTLSACPSCQQILVRPEGLLDLR